MKHKIVCIILIYINCVLILMVTAYVSFFAFASLASIPIWITSSAVEVNS